MLFMHALSIKHQTSWEKPFDPNVAEMRLKTIDAGVLYTYALYFLESK